MAITAFIAELQNGLLSLSSIQWKVKIRHPFLIECTLKQNFIQMSLKHGGDLGLYEFCTVRSHFKEKNGLAGGSCSIATPSKCLTRITFKLDNVLECLL